MAANSLLSDRVESDGPDVVSEGPPGCLDVPDRGAGQLLDRGVLSKELLVLRDDPIDLGLLEHDLRDQDLVRVGGLPPGKVAPVARIPAEEALLVLMPDGG